MLPDVPGGFLSYALGLAIVVIILLSFWIVRLRSEVRYIEEQYRHAFSRATSAPSPIGASAAMFQRDLRPAHPPSNPAKYDAPILASPDAGALRESHAAYGAMEQRLAESTQPEEPPFSEGLARELFERWCQASVRPASTSRLVMGFLQYARAEPAKEFGGAAMHILRDAAQIAEFVRFSEIGSEEALVFPTPEAHFTPVMNHLFPDLTAALMDTPTAIATIAPVHMRRRSATEWERND